MPTTPIHEIQQAEAAVIKARQHLAALDGIPAGMSGIEKEVAEAKCRLFHLEDLLTALRLEWLRGAP